MGKVKSAKEAKKDRERKSRVVRTAHQLAITAFLAVYPVLVTVTDLDSLEAVLPSLGFIVFGAVVTDVYYRIRPA